MGYVYADIELSNARNAALSSVKTQALVDTGSYYLCIPDKLAQQLKLDVLENRQVTLADGKSAIYPYAGPLHLRFENRQTYCGAMIMGDEVLLGAIPMEDMDVLVDPLRQRLLVNPQSPNITSGKVKAVVQSQSMVEI